MDGIMIINKEKGFTSHDVVAKLRGILHIKKIGHTGTLDPMAEGVLPVAIGKGTGLAALLTEKKKTYETVLRLGMRTDTQDITGNLISSEPVSIDRDRLLEVTESFLGPQMQIPPMYSAIKQNGKKLYELAREGKTVERPPRPVHFYDISVLETAFPLVKLRVTCSKGTYIRTLCSDIGDRLGCGGCMEELTRTASGEFTLSESHTLSEIEQSVKENDPSRYLIPVEEVLKTWPRIHTDSYGDRLLLNGNPVPEKLTLEEPVCGWVRLCLSDGRFAGLYEWREEKEQYFPVKMF